MVQVILELYWDNGKENGNCYLGSGLRIKDLGFIGSGFGIWGSGFIQGLGGTVSEPP